MQDTFDVAGGSVQGTEHLRTGRNNQDDYHWSSDEHSTVLLVSDGCGSGRRSEVGARAGVRLLAKTIQDAFRHYASSPASAERPFPDPEPFWRRIRDGALARIRILANDMGGSFTAVVEEYFLFTVVGALVTPRVTTVFSVGDGVIAVNGEVERLGPFPGNRPPYLVYPLIRTTGFATGDFDFRLRHYPTETIETLLVGTDGLADLLDLEQTLIPGTQQTVGPLAQFWEERMFRNSDNVRRRLAVLNRETMRFQTTINGMVHLGLLRDDTTAVALRRRTIPS